MNDGFSRVIVLAPNWLGDVVMALPAIADVRRRFPAARLTVAARRSVADVFTLTPFVDRVVTLEWGGRWWQRGPLEADAARVRDVEAEVAILLPNSFASAWLVKSAAIPERWGYAADLRRPLLTRAVPRPGGSMHQGAYYQHLTRELGIDSGPLEPVLTMPDAVTAAARRFLAERGWQGSRPVVVFAPGAAYGTAKRWIPASVAQVAATLVREHGATCVLVGSRADRETTAQIRAAVPDAASAHVLDVTGETTIGSLAGVMALAAACVSNDSGAMHVAAHRGPDAPGLVPALHAARVPDRPSVHDGHHPSTSIGYPGVRPGSDPDVMRPAVFLDRDGTLIEERGYLDRLDLLELFPWTVDAIRLLNRAGFAAVVVTNQSAIGRGIIDEPFLRRVHETIDARLAAGHARLDAYYYCPHHPDADLEAFRQTCRCRKPQPGLVERACREMQLDPSRSVMVGDRWIDVACGQAAGTRSVLLRTGHGAHEEQHRPAGASADAILNNLMEAVGWILRSSSR